MKSRIKFMRRNIAYIYGKEIELHTDEELIDFYLKQIESEIKECHKAFEKIALKPKFMPEIIAMNLDEHLDRFRRNWGIA